DGHVLVAHNARFDVSFLIAEMARLTYRFSAEALCTLTTAVRMGFPGQLYSCCAHLGIPTKANHVAIDDARVTAQMLPSLVGDGHGRVSVNPARLRPHGLTATGKRLPRSQSSRVPTTTPPSSAFASLPALSTGDADPVAAATYLDLLTRCLEDRVL